MRKKLHLSLSVIFGLLCGLVVVFLAPKWFGLTDSGLMSIWSYVKNRSLGLFYVGKSSYSYAAQQSAPSVVSIFTKLMTDSGHKNDKPSIKKTNLGSGVIISADGYILTNRHLIDNAQHIYISLKDGRQSEASLIGVDSETDVAILKINLLDISHIYFFNSNDLNVGDIVLAIGNPYGFGQTVTQGIVSAIGRNNLQKNTYESFIQTDAAINMGNSGGALVNLYGELVGLNTFLYTRGGGNEGIGFAIPSNLLQFVANSIIKHGEVVRGWLGLQSSALDEFKRPLNQGVMVVSIYKESPAEKAGLLPDDIVVGINNVSVVDGYSIMNMVAQLPPGKKVTLYILRNNEPLTLHAKLSKRPEILFKQ